MYHNFITKENRTSNLYRERRIQHRYHRNNEKPEPTTRDFNLVSRTTTCRAGNQIKTLEFQEFDEWMFSDNRIKNFKAPSQENHAPQIRLQISSKEKNHSKVNPQPPEDLPRTPPFDEELEMTPRRERLTPQKSQRYCFEDNKIGFIGKPISSHGVQSQQTRRRISSALDRRKLFKKNSLSMEISSKRENTLVPTVVSVKLANPTHVEKIIISPKAAKRQIPNQKSKQKGKSCFVLKEKRATEKMDPVQKMKYAINGWQHENPSFHEFQEIYSLSKQQKEFESQAREVRTAGYKGGLRRNLV